MNYFLNRYKNALSRRGKWLLLAFAPLSIYLIASAMRPVLFTVQQKISLQEDGKTTKAVSKRINDIAANSDAFFLSDAVIERLGEEVRAGTIVGRMNWSELPSFRLELILSAAVKKTMSLETLDEKTALVAYHGENRDLGEDLVAFYSRLTRDRLVGRLPFISDNNPFKALVMDGGDKRPANAAGPGKPIGAVEARSHRLPWRSDRLGPSLAIFIVSLILLLGAIGLLEWFDPVIASERQAARYMDIAVFGALPDLKEISGKLH